jgi:succinate dehydrogenase/fumarate reductase flavoprotein subunit
MNPSGDNHIEKISGDILIVGGGAAGCFAAIKAKEHGSADVILVDKGYVGKSGCSKFAAGSFKCFIPQEDDYDLWFSKAVEEGYYINDQQWTATHLQEVYQRAQELDAWGVDFLKRQDGAYDRLEGQGSSNERPIKTMMFHGPRLMDVLRKITRKMGVTIQDKTMMTHLVHAKNDPKTIAGALGFDLRTGKQKLYQVKAVILTAGAQAFKAHYAYQKMVTGDAHVMGLEAGAVLSNYEFCCHHLSCADFDTTGMNVLQGSGARFVNAKGESYMHKYDPEYGDHAVMNRLSAGMACEVMLGRGPIYYDFSSFDQNSLTYFKHTLPIMYRAFERAGYIKEGRIKKRVEWVSVNMGNVGYGGGLKINLNCETNIKGLYAAGDAACGPASGVEGFCAYAIPFATTSGARSGIAATDYVQYINKLTPDPQEIAALTEKLSQPLKRSDGIGPDYVVLKVQELLFPMEIYLIRQEDRLRRSLNRICQLREDFVPLLKAYDPHYLRMAIEASNMATCAELFLRAALKRAESRGSHLREDFPETDNVDWLKWILLKKTSGKIQVATEDIPIETYPMKPKREKYAHPIITVLNNENHTGHHGH